MYVIPRVSFTIFAGRLLFAPVIALAGFADTKLLWTGFMTEWPIKAKEKASQEMAKDLSGVEATRTTKEAISKEIISKEKVHGPSQAGTEEKASSSLEEKEKITAKGSLVVKARMATKASLEAIRITRAARLHTKDQANSKDTVAVVGSGDTRRLTALAGVRTAMLWMSAWCSSRNPHLQQPVPHVAPMCPMLVVTLLGPQLEHQFHIELERSQPCLHAKR